MRQLTQEGWMHNRGRLIVGSFLTKTLYLDWRGGQTLPAPPGRRRHRQQPAELAVGGRHRHGHPAQPGAEPAAQAERYDPDGAYVRRYVPELATIEGPAVHTPWKLPDDVGKDRLPRSDRRARRGPTAVPRRPGGGRAMSGTVRQCLFTDQTK